jgi:branched-chain amino acid transport system ATP-binding protein
VSTDLLAVHDLCAGYGAATVLDNVSFSIAEGSSLALLGRNGVGKSTLLCTLMGLTRQHSGSIRYAGTELRGRSTFQRARLGLGWVPQERGVFPSLTVEEHLAAVARPGPWTAERVYELFPSLAGRTQNRGLQLSGGEQQMLCIARALVTNPRLLLLDEPMEGLAPVIVEQLGGVLRQLLAQGEMSIVLVEQHARLALALTHEVLVLDRGRVVHRGPSAELANDAAAQHRLLAVSDGLTTSASGGAGVM